MLARLTLFQKSLILVLVPLAVQCVFVFTLTQMLQQAELEIRKAEKAQIFATHVNALMRKIIGSAAHVILPNKQGKRAPEYSIQEEFHTLKALAKDDKETLEELVKAEEQWKEALKYALRLKAEVREKVSIGTAFELQELQDVLQKIYRRLSRISVASEKVSSNSPRKQTKTRKKIVNYLFYGLGLNVSIAILLVWLFNKSTTERLNKLMGKARQIESGEKLSPPSQGSDEITELDVVLCEVSTILNKSVSQLKQTDSRIRSIVETLPTGIFVLREKGEIDYVNKRMEDLWKVPQLTFVGSSLTDYIELPDGELSSFLEQQVSQSAYESNGINVGARLEQSFPVEFVVREVRWSDDLKRYLVAVQDISERKRIEKLRSDFTAMLTHNVRSPLNSLLAFIELLARGKYGSLNDKGKESVKTVERGIDLIVTLISDLLDLDKIEAGLLELNIGQTSNEKIIRRSLAAVENLAEIKSIDLETDVEEIAIEADQDRIVQVVVNLVSNAINHCEKDTKILIKSRYLDSDKQVVLFQIIDNGPGIPASKLPTIFDRFTQVSSMKKGSSGLGLTISKALVEDHGGTIDVDSKEGKGSTFWFSIPVNQSR